MKSGQLQTATLRVTGTTAADGTVRVGSGKQVTGTLGGKHFNVNVAEVKLSRAGAGAVGSEWPTTPVLFPLGKLARLR